MLEHMLDHLLVIDRKWEMRFRPPCVVNTGTEVTVYAGEWQFGMVMN